jgi:hypothetical protein
MYDGQWVGGKMHGKGTFVYPNGNRYELIYSPHILLTLFLSSRYDGEFNADMKEGFGILQYVNGERYEGQWKANFAHGTGSLTYADGDKYVGEWIDGKKSGNGELIYVNGDKFRGQWNVDKASGRGEQPGYIRHYDSFLFLLLLPLPSFP